jgi:mannose-6-phosphate isomerase
MADRIYLLSGKIQHYSWGGYEFIPSLLAIGNEKHEPFAEYWMGAHKSASAEVGEKGLTLYQLIRDEKENILGDQVKKHFGDLPYLFKVLDVRDMLSIQVHPSKHVAEKEFKRENLQGIPLNASNRNYKDANHKPELMVALSDFWLLHGFKNEEKISIMFDKVPELNFLKKIFREKGYKKLYQTIMEMPQQEVNERLHPLIKRIVPLYQKNLLVKNDENFWAARAAITFNKGNDHDRGIFSIYLFNLVHLNRWEGIFQDAGIPHAYLEGQNVEIMANSDNVLRGGLTAKHVDVKELMKHVNFNPVEPLVLTGEMNTEFETVYESPASEFELSHFLIKENSASRFKTITGEILLVMEGRARIDVPGKSLNLAKGGSVFIIAGQEVTITAEKRVDIFRASVPVHISE